MTQHLASVHPFPDEIWDLLLKNIALSDLGAIRRVCKGLKSIVSQDEIYKILCQRCVIKKPEKFLKNSDFSFLQKLLNPFTSNQNLYQTELLRRASFAQHVTFHLDANQTITLEGMKTILANFPLTTRFEFETSELIKETKPSPSSDIGRMIKESSTTFCGVMAAILHNPFLINSYLIWSVKDKRLCLVLALLNKGADVQACDGTQWSSLHWAAYYGHLDIATILNQQGANINAQNKSGATPLFIAAEMNKPDIVKYLVGMKANINTPNKQGQTPLWIACRYGHESIVRILLGYQAHVNTQDNVRRSPLWIATRYNQKETVKILLKHHADPDLKNCDNQTPLWVAHKFELRELARLLTFVYRPEKISSFVIQT